MIKYVSKTRGEKKLSPLFPSDFFRLLADERVKQIADKIRSNEISAKEKYEIKRDLPSIYWQIDTDSWERKGLTGKWNGLVVLDIDHMEGDVRKFYEDRIKGHELELNIDFVHRSISGHGLHIGFEANPRFCTIAGNQFWMAHELGLENFDRLCCDLTRSWFVSPREDWFYINPELADYLP